MFRIRHAAKLAGINPTLLRAWERRYHLVSPSRTAQGYRVYSAEDVEVLRAAARLVAAGHSIGEVARLPADERTQVIAQLDRGDAGQPALPQGRREDEAARPATVAPGEVEAAIARALEATAAFDRPAFEAALFPVSTLAGLDPSELCERVLLPLLRRIGDAWERGQLTVAAEHFGSGLCRAKIVQCLEYATRGRGPRVVCACPENELHEGGLLAFAVRAAVAHWQVIYLGAHTPLEQTFTTATSIGADLVALSMTVARPAEELAQLQHLAADARRARPSLRIVAGGSAAVARAALLEQAGIEVRANIMDAFTQDAARSEKTAPG